MVFAMLKMSACTVVPMAVTSRAARTSPVTRETTVPAAIARLAERTLVEGVVAITARPSGRGPLAGAAQPVDDAVAGRTEEHDATDAHHDPDHQADLGRADV